MQHFPWAGIMIFSFVENTYTLSEYTDILDPDGNAGAICRGRHMCIRTRSRV